MKRNLILFLLVLAPFMAMAQNRNGNGYGHNNNHGHRENNNGGWSESMGQPGSALTIFSESGDRFSLMINGVKQNLYPQTRIRVEGLPQVINEIEVIFDDNYTRAIRKTIAFVDPVEGNAINLTLKIIRSRDGYASLCFHKATPLERDYRREQNEYIMAYGRDVSQPQQVFPNTPPPPPPAPAGPVAMDDRSFSEAVQAIRGNSFDDSKLSTAKTIANTNYFTTDQVMTICKLFAFDDSKLAFAKYAFKRTVDNNNYFKVNSVFAFDSDKSALNDYVNHNR